jgi:hypothetical protein
MNTERIKLLLKFCIAVAGDEDEPFDRELGPIHLIKYVYLADLAYAEKHDGQTFTECPWKFHHYGPWCTNVFEEIEPTMHGISASKRSYVSPKYDTDSVRWRYSDDEPLNRFLSTLERDIPLEVSSVLKQAIHKYGSDTSGLLHFVYTTPPMLRAAPGDVLKFSGDEFFFPKPHGDSEFDEQPILSGKAKKRRREKILSMKENIKAKLSSPQSGNFVLPSPSPRYDPIYFEGQQWLDEIAGNKIDAQEGELLISDDMWHSSGRGETGVP